MTLPVATPARIFTLVFALVLLQANAMACAQQPVPLPGPGPVAPGSGVPGPPEVSQPPGPPTEVPIGRLEGYDEEKRKALETPGRPPGAVQQDPAVRGRGADPR